MKLTPNYLLLCMPDTLYTEKPVKGNLGLIVQFDHCHTSPYYLEIQLVQIIDTVKLPCVTTSLT